MGLNYSMISYVHEDNFDKAINWLEKNTHGYNDPPYRIKHVNAELKINTYYLYINEEEIKRSDLHILEVPLDSMRMSFGLKFDLDSAIIKFWEGGYAWVRVPEKVDNYLLPNNQVWVGAFDSNLKRLEKYNLYRVEFTAVTGDMSRMLKESHSARNWLLAFSRECSSKMSLFDFEGEESFIYFEGREMKFETKSLLTQNDKNIPQMMINEFYKYETELYPYYNFSSENFDPIHERINIIEEDYYNIYILGNRWYIEIVSIYLDNTVNFRALSNEEINRFKKEGKDYSNLLGDNYYNLLSSDQHKNLLQKKGLIDLNGKEIWYTKNRY